jgi:BASS family bile acid:Na+ symporter
MDKASTIVLMVSLIIIIPVSIGMLIRRKREAFAQRMARPVRIASGFVIMLGIVVLLLNVATMTVGYFSARIFRIRNKQALSISIESGIQNSTLAISIAVILLGSTAFSIAPAVYSLLMFFTGGVIIYIGLKRDRTGKNTGEAVTA